MAGTQIQRRRGTTAEHAAFTGAVGEVTIDTTKKTTIVHDGATAGGLPQAREDLSNITIASLTAKTTPVDADLALIGDSAAANAPKKLTFANLWAWVVSKLASVAGSVVVTSATGLLGYGTGAGGTVTQATSKTTAVTLNKPTGEITMHDAALGAGASVNFALNNSLIGANDLVVANPRWGAIAYEVKISNTVSGATSIRVTNITGGSLSDALIVRFAVIKGATS